MMESNQFDRRATDKHLKDSKVRQELLEQLSEIESTEYRVMLTLLLKMQDELVQEISGLHLVVTGYMGKIARDIEKISRTEDEIKKIALEPHVDVHPDHHKWLDNNGPVCSKITQNHSPDGLCEWARQAKEDAAVNKVRRWKIVDNLAEKLLWVGLVIIGVTLFPHIKF
jgi:hypothetical protein